MWMEIILIHHCRSAGRPAMASNIVEFFGYEPTDQSAEARTARDARFCPYVGKSCSKTLRDGERSGACTLKLQRSPPVIICPDRLYAENYKVLRDVARVAFGSSVELVPSNDPNLRSPAENGVAKVAVFGKRWGGELSLPTRGNSGSYFVDWILAKLDETGEVESFVAVEVQSIDTTGNYQGERDAYLNDKQFNGTSTAGLNWENVNKRILPQLIYKGNVLRRERFCTKGLFFVCPKQVYDKIIKRLGTNLQTYPHQAGALTFMWYDVGPDVPSGQLRSLVQSGCLTTTVEQVANAFALPGALPPENVYADAIQRSLDSDTG